jgi:hypothetical protein
VYTLRKIAELLQDFFHFLLLFVLFVYIQVVLEVNWIELLKVPVKLVFLMPAHIEEFKFLLRLDSWPDWFAINMIRRADFRCGI